MTEEEWLSQTDNTRLQLALSQLQLTHRKIRLFRVACCLRLWRNITSKHARDVLKKADAYLDGHVSLHEMLSVHAHLADRFHEHQNSSRGLLSAISAKARERIELALFAINSAGPAYEIADCLPFEPNSPGHRILKSVPSSVIRDIFGNPFRSFQINTGWFTETVCAMAQGIYEDRAFDRMPILADALQEAGCENEEILKHCRQPGGHARGCWVVDLLTCRS